MSDVNSMEEIDPHKEFAKAKARLADASLRPAARAWAHLECVEYLARQPGPLAELADSEINDRNGDMRGPVWTLLQQLSMSNPHGINVGNLKLMTRQLCDRLQSDEAPGQPSAAVAEVVKRAKGRFVAIERETLGLMTPKLEQLRDAVEVYTQAPSPAQAAWQEMAGHLQGAIAEIANIRSRGVGEE